MVIALPVLAGVVGIVFLWVAVGHALRAAKRRDRVDLAWSIVFALFVALTMAMTIAGFIADPPLHR